MGRRHQVSLISSSINTDLSQALIIAKVGADFQRHYRCVAAFQCHWLYGAGSAWSATRFIRALKNHTNSILVQADLETIFEYDSEYTERGRYAEDLVVLCPYIAMLYRTSTYIDLDNGIFPQWYMLNSSGTIDAEDNDEGISIFDVTEPANPRYCMVFTHTPDQHGVDPPCYQPMTAEDYVGTYYPQVKSLEKNAPHDTAFEEELCRLRQAYQELADIPLIDCAILKQTFPRGTESSVIDWTDNLAEGHLSEHDSIDPALVPRIPSLVATAVRKILQEVIPESDEPAQMIDTLLQIPLEPPTIELLHADLVGSSQIRNYVLPLLAKVIKFNSKKEGLVNMAPFALSAGQVALLAPMIVPCKILKLGARNRLDIDELKALVEAVPSLKTLVLFSKEIVMEDVDALRSIEAFHQLQIGHKLSYFANIWGIYHVANRRSVEMEFVCLLQDTWALRNPNGGSGRGRRHEGAGYLNLMNPNHIIRALHDLVVSICATQGYERKMGLPQTCFGVGDRPWGAPFASSSLIDLSAMPKLPSKATKWIFVLRAGRRPTSDLPVLYGFARLEDGNVIDVFDLEGFAKALQSERPDLPPIINWDENRDEEDIEVVSGSFYHSLRWLLGSSDPLASASAVSCRGKRVQRLACQLVSPENVSEAITSFIS
ncbi:hypothetical protein M408DRAFT_219897 [Serendipita vermifera MAFF 305830]|uniref:Uncharacterized protein n=1 Tax=Serendipita vermifera MAFF 305830 TaxID=933852 RepID=A0A0C3BM21_SERVB|nr:hypothetical protein M408DRAFT_219897 [Serendipita vermifera MAFF 305830]